MSAGKPSVRYFVTLMGSERVVEILEDGDRLNVTLDGEPVEADLTSLDGNSLHSLLLDGHSREMMLEREGDRTYVSLDGERIEVRVQDEVSRALSAIAGDRKAGAFDVVAPMPGVVVDVPVKAGDEIASGQALVVVEAMKMQNELVAPAAGVIQEIKVGAGTAVAAGEPLVTIEAAGA